jgi:hypothetical protein
MWSDVVGCPQVIVVEERDEFRVGSSDARVPRRGRSGPAFA